MARIEIEEPQPLPITLGQAALRIVIGVIMAGHGWLKLIDIASWQAHVAELGIPYPEIAAYLAIAGELLGGLGLIVGLLTRVAAFGVISVLAVAIGTVHLNKGLFAQNGGFELPLVLAVGALFIMLAGPDALTADRMLFRRARRLAIERDAIWSQPPYVAMPDDELYTHPQDRVHDERHYPRERLHPRDRRGPYAPR
jgi:putative oxidoreductase